jgi:hypothetical protein
MATNCDYRARNSESPQGVLELKSYVLLNLELNIVKIFKLRVVGTVQLGTVPHLVFEVNEEL